MESRSSALSGEPGGANDLFWPIRDGVIGEDHIRAEIGQLIAGEEAGRTTPDQVTLYKSVGVGVQDAVAARQVYDTAVARGIGQEIDF